MKKTEVAVKEKSSVDVSVAGQHDWSILGKSVVKKDTAMALSRTLTRPPLWKSQAWCVC